MTILLDKIIFDTCRYPHCRKKRVIEFKKYPGSQTKQPLTELNSFRSFSPLSSAPVSESDTVIAEYVTSHPRRSAPARKSTKSNAASCSSTSSFVLFLTSTNSFFCRINNQPRTSNTILEAQCLGNMLLQVCNESDLYGAWSVYDEIGNANHRKGQHTTQIEACSI